jgi:hypothetical protein
MQLVLAFAFYSLGSSYNLEFGSVHAQTGHESLRHRTADRDLLRMYRAGAPPRTDRPDRRRHPPPGRSLEARGVGFHAQSQLARSEWPTLPQRGRIVSPDDDVDGGHVHGSNPESRIGRRIETDRVQRSESVWTCALPRERPATLLHPGNTRHAARDSTRRRLLDDGNHVERTALFLFWDRPGIRRLVRDRRCTA